MANANYEAHLSTHRARNSRSIEVLIEFFEDAEAVSAACVSASDADGEFDTVTWDQELGNGLGTYETPPDEALCNMANAFLRSRG